MIVSAMSRRSCRAASGLRRPSETRAYLLKVYYLPRLFMLAKSRPLFEDKGQLFPDATIYRGTEGMCPHLSSSRSGHFDTVPRSGTGGFLLCPSFLPTKACNRTVALSRTNLVDEVSPSKWNGPPHKAKGPTGPGQANTARPCAGPAQSPSLPSVPPKGFHPSTRRVKHVS
ncbi:hypothetical protein THAOC_15192 [Thalassiosira oceanica]|uniref:Uncharacterized protein n=1 Tax=Thalassiosira oceanica TaxID=159749 RepID=K0SSY5_THAOC|nr:hypothetical protein THAOC_15192 [Thalassiosira oceanica]|eukprot:EJK64106.1 hypothetical protein THAOC_15192 [Thalassiosira oceanica]